MGIRQRESEVGNFDDNDRIIGQRILKRAMLDLFDKEEAVRMDAIEFFASNNHNNLAQNLGVDPIKIKEQVMTAISHEGIRREKLVRNIVRDLVGN